MTALGSDLRVSIRRLAAAPGLHRDGRAGAGPGHRRQRRRPQPGPGRGAAAAALRRSRSPRGALERRGARATRRGSRPRRWSATAARPARSSRCAAYTTTTSALTDGDEPERVISAAVTPRSVRDAAASRRCSAATFERRRRRGRRRPSPIVIGHGLWQRRFAGDAGHRRPQRAARRPGPHRRRGDAGGVPPAARLPRRAADRAVDRADVESGRPRAVGQPQLHRRRPAGRAAARRPRPPASWR